MGFCGFFVNYLDEASMGLLLRTINPLLRKEGKIAKKAFKILCSMCKIEKFIKEKYNEVVALMEETTPDDKGNMKSRKYRANIIFLLLSNLEQFNPEIHNKFLPELIYYLLENNAKTRTYAIDTLSHLSALAISQNALPTLINTLCAGLALDSHFSNGALSALTKLSKDFHKLPAEYLLSLIQTILHFIKGDRTSSSIYSALDIIKVIIPLLSQENILKALQSLSDEVKSWQIKKKQKFMMPIAEILRDSKQDGDQLLKMFGYWNIVVKQVQTMKKKELHLKKNLKFKEKKEEGEKILIITTKLQLQQPFKPNLKKKRKRKELGLLKIIILWISWNLLLRVMWLLLILVKNGNKRIYLMWQKMGG